MQFQQMIAEQTLHRLFEQVHGGAFTVIYKDGAIQHYGKGQPQFTIRFNEDSIQDFMGDDLFMSFGEAYIEGRVDVEGDLADLISLALRSGLVPVEHSESKLKSAALRAVGKVRSLKRERENIEHHYNLGNDFFRLWLDESLTYSCGYFRSTSDTLERAQKQKIDHSLRKLLLRSGETLLDIGCGWGALVMRAAKNYETKTTGITLSDEQYSAANAAIALGGLQDNASVRLMDYATLAAEGRQFDKIVSIGMIEHVGKENLAEFVEAVETMLKPGGLALLHLITGNKEGPINMWVEKHIFPGGYIPTFAEIVRHISSRDFSIWDVQNLGPHYRLTLDHWSDRFENAVPTILERFDERFVRMWRLYLRSSSASFREGTIQVHQILISHGQPEALPLTRAYMYERPYQRRIVNAW